MDPYLIAVGIGLGVGICGLGVGIGQGLAANGGLNGMSRQPEAGRQIQNAMLLGLVFLELVFLLTFVLGFLMMGRIPANVPAAGGPPAGASAPSHTRVAMTNNAPNLNLR